MKKEISPAAAIAIVVAILLVIGGAIWFNSSREPEAPAWLPPPGQGPSVPGAPGTPPSPPPAGTQ